MRRFPGIVARVTLHGIWIRPHTGGVIKTSLPANGLKPGDKVDCIMGGAKDRIIGVTHRNVPFTRAIIEKIVIREELDDFDIENWVAPIWDFFETTDCGPTCTAMV